MCFYYLCPIDWKTVVVLLFVMRFTLCSTCLMLSFLLRNCKVAFFSLSCNYMQFICYNPLSYSFYDKHGPFINTLVHFKVFSFFQSLLETYDDFCPTRHLVVSCRRAKDVLNVCTISLFYFGEIDLMLEDTYKEHTHIYRLRGPEPNAYVIVQVKVVGRN